MTKIQKIEKHVEQLENALTLTMGFLMGVQFAPPPLVDAYNVIHERVKVRHGGKPGEEPALNPPEDEAAPPSAPKIILTGDD